MADMTSTNRCPSDQRTDGVYEPAGPDLIAALGPDDEHVLPEDWRTVHPLHGRGALVAACRRLDVAARHGDALRTWWLENRGVAGDMPQRLVELLDAFAGYAESPYRVVCDDRTSRHSEPFASIPEADRFAVEQPHGCEGGSHAIVDNDTGFAIAAGATR